MPTPIGPYWDDALPAFLEPGEVHVDGIFLQPAKGRNDVPGKTCAAVLTTTRICIVEGNLKPKRMHWWFPLPDLARIDVERHWTTYGLNVTRAVRVEFVLTDGETFVGDAPGHGANKHVQRFLGAVHRQQAMS